MSCCVFFFCCGCCIEERWPAWFWAGARTGSHYYPHGKKCIYEIYNFSSWKSGKNIFCWIGRCMYIIFFRIYFVFIKNSTLRYECDETFSGECEFAARAEGEWCNHTCQENVFRTIIVRNFISRSVNMRISAHEGCVKPHLRTRSDIKYNFSLTTYVKYMLHILNIFCT